MPADAIKKPADTMKKLVKVMKKWANRYWDFCGATEAIFISYQLSRLFQETTEAITRGFWGIPKAYWDHTKKLLRMFQEAVELK